MTLAPDLRRPVAARPQPAAAGHPRLLVGILVALAVAVRLPYLAAPARPDEAGYLLVAAAVRPHAAHLYGGLWVDRPPLLIAFFALADHLGGLVALRALSLPAVALLVAAAALAGHTLGGARGARWAAAVAAGLSASPLLGAPEVDGELLAAPLVMASCAVGLTALRPTSRRPLAGLVMAGVLGACAVGVKQNFVDALVFLVVTAVVGLARRQVGLRRGVVNLLALGVGASVPVAAAIGWAVWWGWGPQGLWDALFGFRASSLHVIAAHSTSAPTHRAAALATAALVSGLVPLLALFAVASARRGLRGEAAVVAVVAMVTTAITAIALGGSYWAHYLFELVPAAALAAGLLASWAPPTPPRPSWRVLASGAVVVVVLVSGVSALGEQVPSARAQGCATNAAGAATVSAWLRAHARGGDTALTLYGAANNVLGSGTRPAYPYLWSLPIRTLDPHLALLQSSLHGGRAATWVVQTMALHSWRLDPHHDLEATLSSNYRPVAQLCGRTIYERAAHASQ